MLAQEMFKKKVSYFSEIATKVELKNNVKISASTNLLRLLLLRLGYLGLILGTFVNILIDIQKGIL